MYSLVQGATSADPWRPADASPADPWAPPSAPLSVPPLPQQRRPSVPQVDPWHAQSPVAGALGSSNAATPVHQDLWSSNSQSSPSTDLDEFDAITNRNRTVSTSMSPKANGTAATHNGNNNGNGDPFELNLLGDALPIEPVKKTPQSFLGENSSLVNLDNLVTASK